MNWNEWLDFSNNHNFASEKGILKVDYLGEYTLRIWFEEELDVSIYELDFEPLLSSSKEGTVFQALKDKARFALAQGNHSLNWYDPQSNEYNENTIDIAPECIRFYCQRYGKSIKKAA